jgi:chemotaxis protein MotB
MATATLAKPRKRKAHGHEEEHENHERWLITYADMITLLMVLFIVLYSISQVDLAKFRRLKDGLAGGFGGPAAAGLMDGGVGPMEGGGGVLDFGVLGPQIAEAVRQATELVEQKTFASTQHEIAQALVADGLGETVHFRTEARGLVVTIVTDQVLFATGEADLTSEGRVLIDHLAPSLAKLSNHLAVEGHTDNVPISGRYPSNWELSTARASAVLREMASRHGIAPARMQASGYADQRPVATHDTVAGRASNRRVEIVVLSAAGEAAAGPHPEVTEPIGDPIEDPIAAPAAEPAAEPKEHH